MCGGKSCMLLHVQTKEIKVGRIYSVADIGGTLESLSVTLA